MTTTTEQTSIHATLHGNAQTSLERLQEELHDMTRREHAYQSELSDISGQRQQRQVERNEATKLLQAARLDHQRASLEYDISMNTASEQAKHQVLTDIAKLIKEAESLVLDIDMQFAIDNGILQWGQREKALVGFVKDCQRERGELLKKRQVLEEIAAAEHLMHGKDEQTWILEEIHQAEEAEAKAAASYEKARQKTANLRSAIPSRLGPWQALCRETLAEHVEVTPPAGAEVITRWLELVEYVETNLNQIGDATLQRMTFDMLPKYDLRRIGPRSSQSPQALQTPGAMQRYNAYLETFAAHRDEIARAHRERQLDLLSTLHAERLT